MKKIISIYALLLLISFAFCQNSYAFSTRHHLINIGKDIIKTPLSILNAAFIKGPRDIREIFRYEVYGSADQKKRPVL